jgi:hypothetical protein
MQGQFPSGIFCLDPLIYLLPKTFELFNFPIFWIYDGTW